MTKKTKPKNTLTPKQSLFIQEYLIDLNATRAAVRAGYSKNTAEQTSSRLLRNVKIIARIKKKQAKRADKLELTAEGILKDIKDIGQEAREAGKFGDALKARELLGKHLKLFTDKVETTGDITINVVRFADQPQIKPPEEPKRIEAEVEEP